MNGTDISDALRRRSRGNSILFRRDSPCLAGLSDLLSRTDRLSVAIWGLGQSSRVSDALSERIPNDPRPRACVDLCTRWAHEEIRMPVAKRAILDVHAMAKEMDDPVDAALCHAVGQGCSCVHTPGHGLGLPIYELTAIVLEHGDGCSDLVGERIASYIVDLERIMEEDRSEEGWAGFLVGGTRCPPAPDDGFR